jgi:hypothetical protein
MRNLVAKNDHNRASVHTDRSKEPQDYAEEGLLEYLAQTSENAAQEEYQRSMEPPLVYTDEVETTDASHNLQYEKIKQRLFR